MKRKNDLELLTYWKISDTETSNPDFLEYGTYEEIWNEDLPTNLLPLLANFPEFLLSFSDDKEIVFLSKSGKVFYIVTVPDLKSSAFLRRFLDYGDTGTCVQFVEYKIKGRAYNKMIFTEERGSDEGMIYLDRDCPKCKFLLEKNLYPSDDEPELITCSNFDCNYMDDSKADYSKNLKRFKKEVVNMKKSGQMEITGPTKEAFIKEQNEESEERKCNHCSGGNYKIEHVFMKKEYGDKVASWLNKCDHCHHMTYSSQLSKNDPLSKALFGLLD